VRACQSLDRFEVMFDDDRAVANAGLLLPATLAVRLGLERRANELVVCRDRATSARAPR
jgi:hypothetical protein